jgi:hypothetical protein
VDGTRVRNDLHGVYELETDPMAFDEIIIVFFKVYYQYPITLDPHYCLRRK